jgi:transposase
VASDILGAWARQLLQALIGGATDPAALAGLARGKLRTTLPKLARALAGQCGPPQRFLLAQHLAHLDDLDELIERLSAEVAARIRPVEALVDRVDAIPGVGRRS